MNLCHISEEPDIQIFKPRKPDRADLDQSVGLVWAVTEDRIVNFLTPRDCPRVTYYARPESTQNDIGLYMKPNFSSVVAIEEGWLQRMQDTALYVYRFSSSNFYLQDEIAGYYVSEKPEIPLGVEIITDLPGELARRNCELCVLPSLWPLWGQIVNSSLGYSMCRMRNAKPKEE